MDQKKLVGLVLKLASRKDEAALKEVYEALVKLDEQPNSNVEDRGEHALQVAEFALELNKRDWAGTLVDSLISVHSASKRGRKDILARAYILKAILTKPVPSAGETQVCVRV